MPSSPSRRRKSTGLPPRLRRDRANGNANRRHGYDKPSWARWNERNLALVVRLRAWPSRTSKRAIPSARCGALYCGLGPEVRRRETWIWFAGHWIYGIARKRGVCMVQMRVSPDQFLTCSVTASGPLRRPAASSLFCFATTPPRNNRVPGTPDYRTLRVTVSICDGPSVNAELRPWESRPLA